MEDNFDIPVEKLRVAMQWDDEHLQYLIDSNQLQTKKDAYGSVYTSNYFFYYYLGQKSKTPRYSNSWRQPGDL